MRSGAGFPASRAGRGALALCIGALLALPGCGGDDEQGRPIPANAANRMISLIERADQQSADGTCRGAKAKVREAQTVLENQVPRSVDPDVRRGLADGLDRMIELIDGECQRPEQPEEEDTTTETTVTETVPTETTPTETTPEPEPTQTTPAPQPTETTPQPTETTPSDPGTGGTPPGANAGATGGDG